MINFIDNRLAVSYFVFALIAVVGLLQLVAARRNLVGLSLVPGTRRRVIGYLIGTALTVGSFPVFFLVQEETIFKPGLAGLELLILFSGATIVGLILTLIGASLVQYRQDATSPAAETLPPDVRVEEVDLGHAKAMLYLPSRPGPWPALCAIGDPHSAPDALVPLAQTLAYGGYAVLLLHPDRETAWRYPEALALAPTACTLLARRDDTADDRIGLLGFGLGADLVLRSGSTDKQVKAIIALAPLLDQSYALEGLGILHEMTLVQALSWARFRSSTDLLRHLAPLKHSARMNEGTAVLVVYGGEDGLLDTQRALATAQEAMPGARFETLAGQGRNGLLRERATADAILRWLKGRL